MGAFDAFMESFSKGLSDNIQASEKARLEKERLDAIAMKNENLAKWKVGQDRELAKEDRAFQAEQKGADRKAAEELQEGKNKVDLEVSGARAKAQISAADEKTRKEANKFAGSYGYEPNTPEFQGAVEFFITGQYPAGMEVEAEKKGWWPKIKSWFSDKPPTVNSAPEPGIEAQSPPTVNGFPEPEMAKAHSPAPTEPVSVMGLKPPEPGKTPAPTAAIAFLKKSPTAANISYFKQKYGYIPEGIKQ